MLEKLKLLNAETIRGLIVVTVPLLVVLAGLFGVDEAVFKATLESWAEKLLVIVALGGAVYAYYARTFKATPPLTETAQIDTDIRLGKQLAAKGQVMEIRKVDDGTIVKRVGATVGRQSGGASIGLVLATLAVALGMVTIVSVSGCVTNGESSSQTVRAVQNADNALDFALVFLEGYHATVKTARQAKDAGNLVGEDLERVREVEIEAYKTVRLIEPLIGMYEQARTAENAAALQKAVNDSIAATAVFVREVKKWGG